MSLFHPSFLFTLSLFSFFLTLSLSFSSFPSITSESFSDLSESIPPNTAPFNFHSFIEGDWQIIKSSSPVSSPAAHEESNLIGFYSLTKVNGTTHLSGTYYDNDTLSNEIDNQLNIYIHFDDFSTGEWRVGHTPFSYNVYDNTHNGDSGDYTKLFDFSFFTNSNLGIPHSRGTWRVGDVEYIYVFQCVSATLFSITMVPHQQAADSTKVLDIITYTGRKVVAQVPKTFFGQYGTYLFIGGFFLFNMYVKSKQAQATGKMIKQTVAEKTVVAGSKKEN